MYQKLVSEEVLTRTEHQRAALSPMQFTVSTVPEGKVTRRFQFKVCEFFFFFSS